MNFLCRLGSEDADDVCDDNDASSVSILMPPPPSLPPPPGFPGLSMSTSVTEPTPTPTPAPPWLLDIEAEPACPPHPSPPAPRFVPAPNSSSNCSRLTADTRAAIHPVQYSTATVATSAAQPESTSRALAFSPRTVGTPALLPRARPPLPIPPAAARPLPAPPEPTRPRLRMRVYPMTVAIVEPSPEVPLACAYALLWRVKKPVQQRGEIFSLF